MEKTQKNQDKKHILNLGDLKKKHSLNLDMANQKEKKDNLNSFKNNFVGAVAFGCGVIAALAGYEHTLSDNASLVVNSLALASMVLASGLLADVAHDRFEKYKNICEKQIGKALSTKDVVNLMLNDLKQL